MRTRGQVRIKNWKLKWKTVGESAFVRLRRDKSAFDGVVRQVFQFRRRGREGGVTPFVSFFLGIGEETGNEAEIGANWADFIGNFEDFFVSGDGLKFAEMLY
jgi:hypothetical protein